MGYADFIHKFNKMSRSFSNSRSSANFGARGHSLEVYQRAWPGALAHLFSFLFREKTACIALQVSQAYAFTFTFSLRSLPRRARSKVLLPFCPFFRAYGTRRQRCVAPLSLIKSGRRYFTPKKYNKIDK